MDEVLKIFGNQNYRETWKYRSTSSPFIHGVKISKSDIPVSRLDSKCLFFSFFLKIKKKLDYIARMFSETMIDNGNRFCILFMTYWRWFCAHRPAKRPLIYWYFSYKSIFLFKPGTYFRVTYLFQNLPQPCYLLNTELKVLAGCAGKE